MTHSAVTTRRLNDGKVAMGLEAPETSTQLNDLIEYRNQLHDGICALQSLDDLGSEEANERAWNDMLELQKRYDKIEARIEELRKVLVVHSECPDPRTGRNINTKELFNSHQTSGIEPVYQEHYERRKKI
jgi:hypothetical protein